MQWKIPERVFHAAPAGVEYVCALVDRYDHTRLRHIRLTEGRGGAAAVHGSCHYPDRTTARHGFRIIACVAGPFPATVPLRHAGPACGVRESVPFKLLTLDEGVVFIVTHELFHFLRRTRQIPGVDVEWQADAWARRHVEQFRSALVERTH
jgi:hypothetical protein